MAKSAAASAAAVRGRANPAVDWYFAKHARWAHELRVLRAVALECQLLEELKWGSPCYTLDGNNIVLIHVFREYCALLFFKGALLKDERGLLVQQTKNVQAARQIRFRSPGDAARLAPAVKSYVLAAIAVQKAGLRVALKQTADFATPDEFASKLRELPALKQAFSALTPGRQRGYLLYFSSAKQSKTREARVGKCVPRILAGKGLDD